MDAIHKLAALLPETQLLPHQQSVVDRFKDNPGKTLLYFGLGRGKTLTSIALAEQLGEPYSAIVPASLRENYKKEVSKYTDQQTPVDVKSYTAMAQGKPIDRLSTLIFDEAQRLRTAGSKQTSKAQELANQAKQVVLLSGTPIVNHPKEFAPLANMLTGHNFTPETFSQRYVGDVTRKPGFLGRLVGVKPTTEPDIKNTDELKNLLKGHIDTYEASEPPVGVTREDIPVVMGPNQTKLYKHMWGDLPWILRYKLRHDYPLTNEELRNTLSFLVGPRQVSLSPYPYMRYKDPMAAFGQSTKLQKAFDSLKQQLSDPRKRAVVYSNFIDAGLVPYKAALDSAGIPAGMFYGQLNDRQRKELVENYNNGKLRVAMLGPSGAEGLSFKGTNLVQLLDSHWNAARMRQAEGRALRYDSHLGLPPDLQDVRIERYISQLPPGVTQRLLQYVGKKPTNEKAVDDYLITMAERKDRLNQKFLNILKEIGTNNVAAR